MFSECIIRSFEKHEWEKYREIRLRALKESPDAFGSTFEESQKYSDEAWIARLANASEQNDFAMVATLETKIVGLGWAKIEQPALDIAHLYQMWVSPDARGQGVGRALLGAAISWAKSRNSSKMLLEVTCGDRPARRLYDAFGFKPVGAPQPIREGSELLEQPMELMLSARGV